MTTTMQNKENVVQSAPLQIELRDWFAGQVLAVVVNRYAESNGGIGHDHLPRNCAIHAYRIADAMLEAKGKPA